MFANDRAAHGARPDRTLDPPFNDTLPIDGPVMLALDAHAAGADMQIQILGRGDARAENHQPGRSQDSEKLTHENLISAKR